MYFFISATTEVFPANISFSSLLTREILSSLKNARLFSREKMSSQKSFVLWLLINYIKKYVLVLFYPRSDETSSSIAYSLCDFCFFATCLRKSAVLVNFTRATRCHLLWLLNNIKKYIYVFFYQRNYGSFPSQYFFFLVTHQGNIVLA